MPGKRPAQAAKTTGGGSRPKLAPPAKKRPRAARTEMCVHRLPPEAYCSRGCDG